jgi:hypothetical protein
LKRIKTEDLRRSKLLDALSGEPLAHVNGVLQGLASDETSNETSGESITVTFMLVDCNKGIMRFCETYPAPLVSLIASEESL